MNPASVTHATTSMGLIPWEGVRNPVNLTLRAKNEKGKMKKLVNFLKKVYPRTTTYYYHGQVMTDELERELMKAYMGTGFRGKRF